MVLQKLKAVSFKPGDLVLHPIDLRIMFRTPQDGRVLLDGIDPLPLARERKGDGIPSSAGKRIYQNAPSSGGRTGNVLGDFTVVIVLALTSRRE